MVFRLGWLLKNAHSAFDYVFNSKIKDVASGRVLGGWNQDKKHGGIAPTYGDIKTEKKLAETFMTYLFGQNKELSKHVIHLVFGSFLRFYDQFLELLQYEPNNKFEGDDVNQHIFVRKVNDALRDCQVEDEVFFKWKEEIRKAFVSKNYFALPLSEVPSALCDGRTIVQELADSKKYGAGAYNQYVKNGADIEAANLLNQNRY